MDDVENHSCRVNICIRGLPEATALRDIYRELLNRYWAGKSPLISKLIVPMGP